MRKIINQPDLFSLPYTPVPIRTYFLLNIHEKINVKANSQGFSMNFLRSCLYCWRSSFPKLPYSEHTLGLTKTWDWYYFHNHQVSRSTLNWIEKNKASKFKI
jgi:hypothetical protein